MDEKIKLKKLPDHLTKDQKVGKRIKKAVNKEVLKNRERKRKGVQIKVPRKFIKERM